MFGLGHWEILLILVIVLIVFAAGKLPKVAGELAKGIKSFKYKINIFFDPQTAGGLLFVIKENEKKNTQRVR